MSRSRRSRGMRVRQTFEVKRPSAATIVCTLIGILLGGTAFATAAAGVGLPIAAFKDAGPALYPHLRSVDMRDAQSINKAPPKAKATQDLKASRKLLVNAPLSSDVARSITLGLELTGNVAAARKMAGISDRLTRRDGFIQTRLAQYALEKGDAVTGLAHLDNFLRTYPVDVTNTALMRMVAVLGVPDGREKMLPYIRWDNPWYERYVGAAVETAPKAANLAQLLLRAKTVPDGELVRRHYMLLFDRLVKEGQFDLAARLYPRLPGTDSAVLNSIKVTPASVSGKYAPAAWSFGDSSRGGGAAVETANGLGIEFFAQADSVSVVGRKLVRLPKKGFQHYLYWGLDDKAVNPAARAKVRLTCGRKFIDSANLFSNKIGSLMRIPVPSGCATMLMEIEIYGGVGRYPARLVMNRINIRPGATPRGASSGQQ